MFDNQKTARLVQEILESDLYLLELCTQGLINYSALARNLLPAIKKRNPKATTESIMVAIKRHAMANRKTNLTRAAERIIANTQLVAKNDIIHLSFQRTPVLLQKLVATSGKVAWDREEIFFFNQGAGEVTVIIDRKNRSLLSGCREWLGEETKALALLSLKENPEPGIQPSIQVPGIYSYFISQLSRNGINIIEILSTQSQISIVLAERNLMTAYQLLETRIRYFRAKTHTVQPLS